MSVAVGYAVMAIALSDEPRNVPPINLDGIRPTQLSTSTTTIDESGVSIVPPVVLDLTSRPGPETDGAGDDDGGDEGGEGDDDGPPAPAGTSPSSPATTPSSPSPPDDDSGFDDGASDNGNTGNDDGAGEDEGGDDDG